MEKYFGNAYRGDPGVPHADPASFGQCWLGAFGFSVFTWFSPYIWQRTTEVNHHDRAMVFEHYHWKQAKKKGQEYEFQWNKLPKEVRDQYYFNWPTFFP